MDTHDIEAASLYETVLKVGELSTDSVCPFGEVSDDSDQLARTNRLRHMNLET